MAMAVFRAVETKRSLVRSANTGISAFVDPVGNITLRSNLFVPASLTDQVSLWEEETVFSRAGAALPERFAQEPGADAFAPDAVTGTDIVKGWAKS